MESTICWVKTRRDSTISIAACFKTSVDGCWPKQRMDQRRNSVTVLIGNLNSLRYGGLRAKFRVHKRRWPMVRCDGKCGKLASQDLVANNIPDHASNLTATDSCNPLNLSWIPLILSSNCEIQRNDHYTAFQECLLYLGNVERLVPWLWK